MAKPSLAFLHLLARRPRIPISRSGIGLSVTLDLRVVDGSGTTHSVGSQVLALRGPGDVLGLSPRMIARTEPPADAGDFEPDYFPFVEFVDADLPWRYSLDELGPDSSRARPWLSLIVLNTAEIEEMATAGISVFAPLEDGREALAVRTRYLPALDEAWAAAHVQIIGLQPPLAGFVDAHPALHFSRVFCFRRLAPHQRYVALLVPTYKAAVDAAFKLPAGGTGDEPAWVKGGDSDLVRLPIYYRWSFATSEAGDFEQLARALQPAPLGPEDARRVGIRAVDANLMVPRAQPTGSVPTWYAKQSADNAITLRRTVVSIVTSPVRGAWILADTRSPGSAAVERPYDTPPAESITRRGVPDGPHSSTRWSGAPEQVVAPWPEVSTMSSPAARRRFARPRGRDRRDRVLLSAAPIVSPWSSGKVATPGNSPA